MEEQTNANAEELETPSIDAGASDSEAENAEPPKKSGRTLKLKPTEAEDSVPSEGEMSEAPAEGEPSADSDASSNGEGEAHQGRSRRRRL